MMSYVDSDPAAPATGAARVGSELRTARQRLGWQLPDMAQSLRIRLPYLAAIEEGRVADLPGNAYAVGFVRTYANALGLDADEVARRFRAEAQGVNRKTELAFPAPVPERGIPAGAVILLGVLIAGGAYVGWYRYTGRQQPPAEIVTAVPDRLAPLVPQPTPSPSPQVASLLPPPVSGNPPAVAVLPAIPVPTPVPVTVAPPPPPPQPSDTRIVIRAKADSWMQVREKQGAVLFNRVLRNGETWPVPARANLLLTTGNAGGTELLVDGVVAPPLGAAGAMKRDIPLEPDPIKAGRTAPPRPRPEPPKPEAPRPAMPEAARVEPAPQPQ